MKLSSSDLERAENEDYREEEADMDEFLRQHNANEFKGTPGPWFHHGPSGSQHTMGGYVNSSPERNSSNLVCSIYGTNGQPHEENAKLIAASPKLFKAVNDFLNHFEGSIPLWLFEEAEGAVAEALGK